MISIIQYYSQKQIKYCWHMYMCLMVINQHCYLCLQRRKPPNLAKLNVDDFLSKIHQQWWLNGLDYRVISLVHPNVVVHMYHPCWRWEYWGRTVFSVFLSSLIKLDITETLFKMSVTKPPHRLNYCRVIWYVGVTSWRNASLNLNNSVCWLFL